jgi:signal peptidase II
VKKRLPLILAVAIASLAADQLTKMWARSALQGKPSTVLVEGYLDFQYHENPGSAFGLLGKVPGSRYILIVVGLGALVFMWMLVRKVEHRQRLADVSFGLIAGGAVGNLVDRIYLGRVVDFIVMHWQRRYVWPAYNIADMTLVFGVGLILIALGRKKEGAAASKSARRGQSRTRSKRRKR